jgi:hypothetical protein
MDCQYVCKIVNDAIHQRILHFTVTWAEGIGTDRLTD